MHKFLFLFLLIGLSANATTSSEVKKAALAAQADCGSLIRFSDKYLAMGFSRGKFRIVSLENSETFELLAKAPIRDIAIENEIAFVLTPQAIEEWDLKSKTLKAEYPTYITPNILENKQQAEAFALYGDTLVIAHGRLGVSFFNIKTKRIVNQFRLIKNQLPLESVATGVTVSDGLAYLVLDNFHLVKPPRKPPFRGVVVVDIKTQKVIRALDGMDPGADGISTDGNKVVVSFMGNPIWKYNINSLMGTSMPDPELRLWDFPIKGHPTGHATLDKKYYYTCYLRAPSFPGENGGYYKNIAVALDRNEWNLE
ncbi:MAG: hypothetical protein M9962_02980 [Oligoflexia bacterium]|nr:hypothetical protein [Oligoflexia bacterium]